MSCPSRNDLIIYAVTMVLMCLVGIVGFGLHINTNLVANGSILLEGFVRGSPFLAPMLGLDWTGCAAQSGRGTRRLTMPAC